MGRDGREGGTSATRVPRLLPVLTPARCCWPDEMTFSLSFHSPEIKEKIGILKFGFIKPKGARVRIGLPRADVFYPEMEQQSPLRTLYTMHLVL